MTGSAERNGKNMKQMKKQLVCENGARFVGQGFGADVERVAELVFSTAMVG